MRISDWSSDVCSSDLSSFGQANSAATPKRSSWRARRCRPAFSRCSITTFHPRKLGVWNALISPPSDERRSGGLPRRRTRGGRSRRSEEHTSELQSLMRISYAVFWLKKKKIHKRKLKTKYTQ